MAPRCLHLEASGLKRGPAARTRTPVVHPPPPPRAPTHSHHHQTPTTIKRTRADELRCRNVLQARPHHMKLHRSSVWICMYMYAMAMTATADKQYGLPGSRSCRRTAPAPRVRRWRCGCRSGRCAPDGIGSSENRQALTARRCSCVHLLPAGHEATAGGCRLQCNDGCNAMQEGMLLWAGRTASL